MPTIEEVTRKYVELRDRKAELTKKHQGEMVPFNEAMEVCENWLLDKMNTLGCANLKNAAGTPYKANQNSVRMEDAARFKEFIFAPAIEAVYHYLCAVGYGIQPADLAAIKAALQEKSAWDMVDFRAGKKGILEYQEQNNALPPGVAVETSTVINVRGA